MYLLPSILYYQYSLLLELFFFAQAAVLDEAREANTAALRLNVSDPNARPSLAALLRREADRIIDERALTSASHTAALAAQASLWALAAQVRLDPISQECTFATRVRLFLPVFVKQRLAHGVALFLLACEEVVQVRTWKDFLCACCRSCAQLFSPLCSA